MSFGRPPSFTTFSAAPPDRGSFPLDHDGECSKFMKEYLSCLKENQNNNGKCRHLSKKYLNCRMEHGLMGTDNFKNLGFHDDDSDNEASKGGSGSSPSHSPSTPGTAPPSFSTKSSTTSNSDATSTEPGSGTRA